MHARQWAQLTLAVVSLLVSASAAFAQQAAPVRPETAKPAPLMPPPLLFKESWTEPPFKGERDDVNMRITPAVVTNERIELKLYGPDSKVVRVARHEDRFDLWTGMATSPVALTLRDKKNYLDLTGLARLRWIVRTNAIHTLYPVVKAADGTLLVGNRAINTHDEFLTVDVPFTGMRWYRLDPAKVVVLTEAERVDLSKVDEVGLATLSPGGGHGIAGSANFSNVELYAKAVPR